MTFNKCHLLTLKYSLKVAFPEVQRQESYFQMLVLLMSYTPDKVPEHPSMFLVLLHDIIVKMYDDHVRTNGIKIYSYASVHTLHLTSRRHAKK